jgi:hypothetical protein
MAVFCMLYLRLESSFLMMLSLQLNRPGQKNVSPLNLLGAGLSLFVVSQQRSPQRSSGAARGTEEASFHLFSAYGTYVRERLMTKQQKTALNMAKFIQAQSLLLLEKLNELDLDDEADMCEKLHEDAERLHYVLLGRLEQE